MPFANVAPSLGPSAHGASMALRRAGERDENKIAEALLAQGFSPEEVSDATGLNLDGMADDGMDPWLDPGGAEPDTFGVLREDQGEEPGPWDPMVPGFEQPGDAMPPPETVDQTIDQELDPLGTQAQRLADQVSASPRIGITPEDPAALTRLLEQQKAEEQAGSGVFSRIVNQMTGGAGGDFDTASTENPDPGVWDMLKSAGGKITDVLGKFAPGDAAAQGMMAAGLGMLGAQGTYGNSMSAIGQGGGEGIKVYQQAKRREDVAKAKADQLASLEKRADANIKMKREELAAKTRDSNTRTAQANERLALARLREYRMMADQGMEREARELFANDIELQQLLGKKDIQFTRGSSWIKGGGADGEAKSMGAIEARIEQKLIRGEQLSETEVMSYLRGKNIRRTAVLEVAKMKAANPTMIFTKPGEYEAAVDAMERDLTDAALAEIGMQREPNVDDLSVPGASGAPAAGASAGGTKKGALDAYRNKKAGNGG